VVQQDRDYKARLTPEYAVLGAVYVGNTGAAGSGQLLLGDMLANHYLLIGGNLRSELDESELLLQYANLGRRWQWGIAGYQFRDDIGVFTAPDSARYRSLVRRGVAAQLAYPFNRFRRVEFSVDLQTVSDEVAQVLFVNGEALVSGGTRSQFYYAIPELALVHDNSAYSGFTPVTGGRWRAAVSQAVGDIDFTFGLLDWRRYFNIKTRGALAVRLLGAGSRGEDTQILRIGGPDTFRGADYGEIVGTRVAIGNFELRFPIIPSTELIRGVVFVDAATAWDTSFSPKLADSGGPLGLTLRDLNLAYGFGVRGYIGLPLRFDAAIPTDLRRNGDWRTNFSIGLDF
jgi:outer membrane protein assembly factor BamA